MNHSHIGIAFVWRSVDNPANQYRYFTTVIRQPTTTMDPPMTTTPAVRFNRLLLTGAAGGLGKVLRERLRPYAHVRTAA